MESIYTQVSGGLYDSHIGQYDVNNLYTDIRDIIEPECLAANSPEPGTFHALTAAIRLG